MIRKHDTISTCCNCFRDVIDIQQAFNEYWDPWCQLLDPGNLVVR